VLNISENPLENGKAEVLHLVLEHLGDCTLISDMAANNLIAELSVIE
jgi:hypothetical protein